MNTLSVIILIVAISAMIYGFRRGIVREAVSFCAIILGVVACRLFSTQATAAGAKLIGVDIDSGGSSHYAAAIVGSILVFIIVWLAVFLIGRLLRGAVKFVRLGIVDSIIGAVYCTSKWLLVLSLLLNLLFLMVPHAGFWGTDPPQGIPEACLGFAPWLFGIVTQAVQ